MAAEEKLSSQSQNFEFLTNQLIELIKSQSKDAIMDFTKAQNKAQAECEQKIKLFENLRSDLDQVFKDDSAKTFEQSRQIMQYAVFKLQEEDKPSEVDPDYFR